MNRRNKHRNRNLVEALESRLLMAIVSVTNNLDTGEGSLRDAISVAQSGDTVDLSGRSGTITFGSEIAFAKDLTITGPGSGTLALDGGGTTRLFNITGGIVSFSDLKMSHGNAASGNNGGAIQNRTTLSLSRVVFDSNHALAAGGAIDNYQGALTATNCTFLNNDATATMGMYGQANGGAIRQNDGSLALTGCTFANNSAIGGGDGMMGGRGIGGALYLGGNQAATVINCTFTGNTAKGALGMMGGSGVGGAIATNKGGGGFTMTNCTMVNNTATGQNGNSGGIWSLWGGATTQMLTNTIAWNNTGSMGVSEVGPSSQFVDGGNNLIGVADAGGAFTNGVNGTMVGVNPLINALASNGGSTQTISLQSGSPAINAANNATAPTTDQRGLSRVGTADIGAYEFGAVANAAPTFTSDEVTSATSESLYTYSITTNDGDSDPVTISATTLPSWLTLTDNADGTATLSGTPTNANSGNNDVVLKVSDGTDFNTQTFTIAVAAINHDPSFTSTSLTSATSESVYTYNITTTDPESGDTLTITAPTLPSWLTLTDNADGTATLTGTPTNADAATDADNSIVLKVSDGTTFATQSFSIDVTAINHAPTFTSTGITTATSESVYTYDITATDSDGNPLSINAQLIPAWLTFTDNGDGTATLTGTPTNADVGSNSVELKLSDNQVNQLNTYDLQSFSIDVAAINHAPTFTSTAVTTVTSEELYSYTISTTDSDGDPVIIDADTLPSWLTLVDNEDGTATLSGTPTNADTGPNADNSVVLNVSDDNDSNMQSFSITVTAINHKPTFSSTAGTTVTSEQLYSYSITTTDVDGNPLTISADTLPSWMTLTDNGDGTATLSGTPTNANAGNNSVALKVSDGSMSDTQLFTVAVTAVNHAPTFTSTTVGKTTATSETLYSYTISTTDSDGNPLTITAPTKPSWLTLVDNGNGTATLSGTPLNANAGNNSVVLRVGDGTTTTDQSYTIAVAAINHAPTFSSTASTTATGGKSYSYNIATTDVDGNPLTITAASKPAWMTLTDNHNGTATLSGTPSDGDYGSGAVVLQVSDGTVTVAQNFSVEIGLQDVYLDSTGSLHVNGTEAADVIVVSTRGDTVRVSRNGIIKNYAKSKVNSVEVRGLGGADSITLNNPGVNGYAIGGDGNDTLTGGEEDDILTGGAGADRIYGMGGNDRLNGMGGADRLYGGEGSDRLYGGDSNDTLDGGSGIDRFYGEDGNDVFIANDKKKDLLYGGAGMNSAIVDTLLDDSNDIDSFLAAGSVAGKHKRRA